MRVSKHNCVRRLLLFCYLWGVLSLAQQRARQKRSQSTAEAQPLGDTRKRNDREQDHGQERLLRLALRHQQEKTAQDIRAWLQQMREQQKEVTGVETRRGGSSP